VPCEYPDTSKQQEPAARFKHRRLQFRAGFVALKLHLDSDVKRLKLLHDYVHPCQQYGQQEKSYKMVRILFGMPPTRQGTPLGYTSQTHRKGSFVQT